MKQFLPYRTQGATTTELGLLTGLIAVALLTTVSSVGGTLSTLFGNVNQALGSAATGNFVSPEAPPLSCTTTISGGENVNLAAALQAPCNWDGLENMTATITLSGIFSSASTSLPSLLIDLPENVTLTVINTATIQGAGGAGGEGGWITVGQGHNAGYPGQDGGTAVEIRSSVTFDNQGSIWGGGGGGGGGATLHYEGHYAGGGSGGGGAGRHAGAAGFLQTSQYGSYPLGNSGSSGTATAGGSGGAGGVFSGESAGAGGAGGGPGQAGGTGSLGNMSVTPAVGGAAGAGILLNGGTVTWVTQGDILPAL